MCNIICPVCSNTNISIFIEGLADCNFKITTEKFNLYRCADCDAKFQHPFIPENEVVKYYPNSSYHPFQLKQSPISSRLRYYPQSIYIRELMKTHKSDDIFSLIDVGCGGGTFLLSVKKYFPNAQLIGVDVSEIAIKNLKSSGIDGVCNSLYDFKIDKTFDYIISSQVLEHLNEPYLFLKKIKELAKNHSIIMVDIPATDSFSAIRFGRNWVHWDLPRHSILYSSKTFSYLIKEFDTIKLQRGGALGAVLSSYKISKQEDIFLQSFLEKGFLKIITPIAKICRMDFLFSDKLIWIGRVKGCGV